MEQRVGTPTFSSSSTSHGTIKVGYTVTHGWEHTTALTTATKFNCFFINFLWPNYWLKKANKNKANLGHEVINSPFDPQLSNFDRHALMNPLMVVQDAQVFMHGIV